MISYEKTRRLTDVVLAKHLLEDLTDQYPGFQDWYINQCMPGILVGNDSLIVAKEHGKIIGVALGKARDSEAKLRCIRVAQAYQSRGIGLHLIDKMLLDLDVDKPHCTVSEEMFHLYSRPFVERYGFNLNHVAKGMYRPGKLEYIFNSHRLRSSTK